MNRTYEIRALVIVINLVFLRQFSRLGALGDAPQTGRKRNREWRTEVQDHHHIPVLLCGVLQIVLGKECQRRAEQDPKPKKEIHQNGRESLLIFLDTGLYRSEPHRVA